ncbi:MAG: 30S ribosomal protein S6e [Candidatus Aenigmarchaeota archaeon ex4484_52]|nr:MAG: 30S ribosomal protein S6e [Candidatus Aenigmarchaeota archaeon ex4484_52]
MTNTRIIVSNPKSGKTYQRQLKTKKIKVLTNFKIGDVFDAGIIDFPAYKFQITGGTDKNGFPMRKGFFSASKKRILISRGQGIKNKKKGIKRRKMVCGSVITEDIAQINCKITKYGNQEIDTFFEKKQETNK